MKFYSEVSIDSDKSTVWQIIGDIENSSTNIDTIKEIEILEKASDGLTGLKWRETRIMFGKEATEVMWITDWGENTFYQTRAESHGAIYISRLEIDQINSGCVLKMSFDSQAESFGAKFWDILFGKLMKKSTEKSLLTDLLDIKRIAESAKYK